MCPSLIKRTKLLLLALLVFGAAMGQSREELEKKRKQKLEEIAFTQKLIDQTGEAQKKKLNYLIILSNQIKNREQLIYTEQRVLKMLSKSIDQTTLFIEALENDLVTLKKEYVEMAYFAFKNRSSFDYLLFDYLLLYLIIVLCSTTVQERANLAAQLGEREETHFRAYLLLTHHSSHITYCTVVPQYIFRALLQMESVSVCYVVCMYIRI